MDALIMAGGMGRRLSNHEKPLTLLLGKPLISYVIDALIKAKNIDYIYVATTQRVKKTNEWLYNFKKKHKNIEVIETPGKGFVNDMILAVEKAGISGEVFIIMADLPMVTSNLIDRIIEKYYMIDSPALSVYMKLEMYNKLGLRPDTVFHRDGSFIVPCGINILNANMIKEEQEDYNLILEDEIIINVNTTEELRLCENLIKQNHP